MDRPTVSPADVRAALGMDRRRSWESGPAGRVPTNTWECFDDDTLLAWLQGLPAVHGHDEQLLEIVRSDRHFYVRQNAALRITDPDRLKPFGSDRHVGQILARRLSRVEDVSYLSTLVDETRHLEVKRAAQAQLVDLRQRLGALAQAAEPAVQLPQPAAR
jgi:hypothetical protein